MVVGLFFISFSLYSFQFVLPGFGTLKNKSILVESIIFPICTLNIYLERLFIPFYIYD